MWTPCAPALLRALLPVWKFEAIPFQRLVLSLFSHTGSRPDNVFEDVKMFRFDDTEDTLFKGNVFPANACLNAEGSTFTSGSNLPVDCY